jgi:solute carrier family 25 (mitochondrial carnitine/acylcarnitine transporter), member 20/29
MVDCATRIFKNDGPMAFYRGTTTPLLGVGLCVSIQFGVVEHLKRTFAERNARNGIIAPKGGSSLTTGQLYASGVIAGVANSFVAGPVEHVRIRLQAQQTKLYAGPWDCIKQYVCFQDALLCMSSAR